MHSLRKEPAGTFAAASLKQDSVKECFESLANALGLSEKSVADLRKSHKYSTLLKELICGSLNATVPDVDESCAHEEIQSLVGHPLVSLNRSNGDPILAGFFTTSFENHDDSHHHHHHHYLPGGKVKSDRTMPSYRSYFTLLGSLHKWIVMAIA